MRLQRYWSLFSMNGLIRAISIGLLTNNTGDGT